MNYNTIGTVRLAKRLKTLEKGDVILDCAFNRFANGVTRYSLCVWETIKKHIDVTRITQAEMTFSQKDWFTLILTHKDGYTFKFKGLASGYHGEGSRGTEKVLLDCGFGRHIVDYIFIIGNDEWQMKKWLSKRKKVKR